MAGIFRVNPETKASVNRVAYKIGMFASKLKMPTFYNIGAAAIGVGGKLLIKEYKMGEVRKAIENDMHPVVKFSFTPEKVMSMAYIMNIPVNSKTNEHETGIWTVMLPDISVHYSPRDIEMSHSFSRFASIKKDWESMRSLGFDSFTIWRSMKSLGVDGWESDAIDRRCFYEMIQPSKSKNIGMDMIGHGLFYHMTQLAKMVFGSK